MRRSFHHLAAFCVVLSHYFITPAAAVAQVGEERPLRMAVATAPKQLDPLLASDAASARLLQLTHPALLRYDEAYAPVALAGKCVRRAPLSVVCTLTEGLLDVEGTPFGAAQAVRWYETVRGTAKSPLAGLLKNVEAFRVLKARQFEMKLVRPTLGILDALVQIPLANPTTGAGLGPYKIMHKDTVGAVLLEMTKVSRKENLPPKIIFTPVADATTRLLKLQKDEVDVLVNDVPPELIPYAREKGFEVKVIEGTSYAYLLPNWKDGLLSQWAVRKALALSLDKPLLRASILAGAATTPTTLLPPTHPAAWAAPEEPLDIHEAALLLEEGAGMIADGEGMRVEMELSHSTDATTQRLAQAMQAMVRRVGIDLKLRPMEWASFYDAVRNGKTQLALMAWTGELSPPFYYSVFNSKQTPAAGGLNRGSVNDDALDALTNALMAAQTEEEVVRLSVAVQKRAAEVLPYIPLYRRSHVLVMGKGITGCTMTGNGGYLGLLGCKRK